MHPTTIVLRVSLAAALCVVPVIVLAGPAAAAVAADDAYVVDEDAPLTGNVLTNDVDQGPPITAELLAPPAEGTLTLDPSGAFVYQPAANFNGTDTFTYSAVDGVEPVTSATVTITVVPVVDAVVGGADSFATPGGTQLTVAAPGVLANDTSPDGRPLTVGPSTPASGGTVAIAADGSFTYLPTPGFRGVDTFTYVVGDVLTTSAPVVVTVAVGNTAPVAAGDAYVLDEDTTLTAPPVLGNDADANGDPLSAVLVSGPGAGSLALAPDGTFVYTPAANVNGVDSFTYQASDGTDVSAAATVTLTIDPVPDAPTFAAPAYAAVIAEDTTYSGLATALNPDGLPLSYTITGPGAVVIDPATGVYTVTPPADFFGVAPVEVLACDTLGRCAQQLISLTVTDVPDVLTANDMDITLFAGPGVDELFDVVNPDGAVLTYRVVVAPVRGTVAISSSTQSFLYTSSAGTSGDDSFVYEVCDPSGLCDTATVTIRPYAGTLPIRPSIGFLVCQSSATTPEAAAACGPFIECIFRVATPAERIACYQAAFGALGGPGAQPTAAAQVSTGGQARPRVARPGAADDVLAATGGDVGSLALGALAVVGCGSLLVARGSRRPGRP